MSLKLKIRQDILKQYDTNAIHSQIGDPFVDELVSTFEDLVADFKARRNVLYNTFKIFTDPNTKHLIEKIDKIIQNRFGFAVEHVGCKELGCYCVFVSPPPAFNGLYNDCLKDFEDMVKNKNVYEKMQMAVTSRSFSTIGEVIKQTRMNYENIDSTMNSKGVKIDLKNAKISNLPGGYKICIVSDMYELLGELEFTGRELAAVLLHEVGHIFNSIAAAYQNLTQSRTMIESISQAIVQKNMTPKDAFILHFSHGEKNSEKYVKDYKDTQSVAVHLMSKFATDWASVGYNRVDRLEDEMMEDRFATRFGLGAELSTGLNKLYSVQPETLLEASAMSFEAFFLVLAGPGLIVTIFCICLFGLTGFIIANVLGILLATLCSVFLYQAIDPTARKHDNGYEQIYKRQASIRRELIKLLKENMINNQAESSLKEVLLHQIDTVELALKRYNDNIQNRGLIARWLSAINPLSKVSNHKELNYLIGTIVSDLMDNSLYASTARLDTLIKGK